MNNIIVKTQRLVLKPMTAEELQISFDNDNFTDQHLKEVIKNIITAVSENEEQFMWYTNWNIICTGDNNFIGGIMIKSEPAECGEVEIGYGIDSPYQNKGYMTEAIGGLVNWMFEKPAVKYVIAETDKYNLQSHKVLIKNKFEKYKQTENEYWWRVENTSVDN